MSISPPSDRSTPHRGLGVGLRTRRSGGYVRGFLRQRRGVALFELGVAIAFLLLPLLLAIAGFGQSTIESAGVSRGLNDAVGIWSQGYIQNPPTGTAATDAATDETIRVTAENAFLAAANIAPNRILLHFVRVTYNTTTSAYVGTDTTEGSLAISSSQYKYAFSNGVPKNPYGLTVETTDRAFIVEVWYQHPGFMGPFSTSSIVYGNRVIFR